MNPATPVVGAPRIVAVGASAGGLEPLEQLFAALPVDTGCSFVVIQHLSPDFRSMMAELLARHTRMPIERLATGTVLRPDTVYLNLPRMTATLVDGVIRQDPMDDQDDLYRPIDRFMASLGDACGKNALAIVLSGTASDGTRGAARVRERGGKVIAQSPETARFQSMPRAVIDAGLDDATGDPVAIARLVQRWVAGERLEAEPLKRKDDDPILSILELLRHHYDTDFGQYKPATVSRRIHRRAELRHCHALDLYYDMLVDDATELDELYGDLLIEVTAFFRDKGAFAQIETKVIPSLVEKLTSGDQLRLWIAGCASGEEAYSLAMLLVEHADTAGATVDVKFIATDVHGRSLERANTGTYPRESVAHMPAERVRRFFDVHDDVVIVKEHIRRLILFSTHDVLRDTPFTQIDLLSCRNLLIYFNDDAQEQVLTKFHFSLQKSGFLILGPSESTASVADEFETIDARWRIYRKKRSVRLQTRMDLIPLRSASARQRGALRASERAAPKVFSPALQPLLPDERALSFRRAHNAALEQIVAEFAPPGFLLTGSGDLVHIFGDAGQLLPLQQGAFSRRMTDLIRPEFRAVLFACLQKAAEPDFERIERCVYLNPGKADPQPWELVLAPVRSSNEEHRFVLLSIRSLELQPPDDALSTLSAMSAAPALTGAQREHGAAAQEHTAQLYRQISALELGLRASEESLQSTVEELETTNEELQSTNEELSASNQELQSTNEELHSVNEELYTVSSEHQRKVEELSELTEDMDLLLRTSEIGTLHFDRSLRVKRYSDVADTVFDLASFRIGSPAELIESRVPDLDIGAWVRRVADSLDAEERQIDIGTQHVMVRVRPSVDSLGRMNGVLVSCFDLTRLVSMQNELLQAGRDFQAIVEDTESFIVRWRADDGRVTFCNSTYSHFFDQEPDEVIGRALQSLIPDTEQEGFFAGVRDIPPNQTRYLTVLRQLPDGGVTYTVGYTRAITDEHGVIAEYQSTGQDLSNEYRYRRALEDLVGVGNATPKTQEAQLTRILQIGLAYYELDSAVLAQLTRTDYRVLAMAGKPMGQVKKDDVLPREHTVCDMLHNDRSVLGFHHLSQSSRREHPSVAASGVESYIGIMLRGFDGMEAAISFSSSTPRHTGFTVPDESFMLLISNWMSTLLDERRRLGLISDENRFYQSLYLNVPVMMFLADEDGLLIEISDQLLERLNLNRSAVVGGKAASLFVTADQGLAAGALQEGGCRDLPMTLARENREPLDCEMSCQLRDLGSLQRVRMCVLTDVSARNRALEATEEHNRRLELANENLNQFAFVASHDLQEPLRKIQQFSSFLQEDYSERIDDDGRYHLRVIVDAAERMSRLIKDLLEYSRTSRDSIEPRRLALRGIVDEVMSDLEIAVREADAHVVIDQLPTVDADPMLVRQLFANLIGNALKYRDDSRRLTLAIRTCSSNASMIEIADNGIGFDTGYADRIFEPFTRLNTVKQYPGSGIGLAICSTVCMKHGWTLDVISEPGRGSTFQVDLAPRAHLLVRP